ncbi:MAG: hypothetical protein Q9168_001890 [Polycauliona sp. 1 TL-2023]
MASPSTLRSRPTASSSNPKDSLEKKPSPSTPSREYNLSSTSDDDEPVSRVPSFLDILRLLLVGILLSTTLSYFITSESLTWGYRPAWTRPARVRACLNRYSAVPSPSPLPNYPSTTAPPRTSPSTSPSTPPSTTSPPPHTSTARGVLTISSPGGTQPARL